MGSLETLIFLITIAIILIEVAQRLHIPYPVALVVAGTAISFFPGIKQIDLNPNSVLLILLPPILYYAAFWVSNRELRRNLTEILSLALGLVVASTLIIGMVFKWLFPDLPWALAFAFGAIVSPPDAAAASTILKRFSISSRLKNVLEGESLINDASGIIIYKLALAFLMYEAFNFKELSLVFTFAVLGGIILGVVSGYFMQFFSRYFLGPVVGVAFSFTIPYVTYAFADILNVSGVLAVVVNGLIGSHIVLRHQLSQRRILAFASWDIFFILINCFMFMLIGTQLKGMVKHMHGDQILIYTGYGLFFTFVLILVRMIWIYVYNAVHTIRKRNKNHFSALFRESTILGWSSMRGIVSLAMALALPYTLPDGSNLPGRDIVVFMTFIVILMTLLLTGLTLPAVMRWLKVKSSFPEAHALQHFRRALSQAAREEIQHLHTSSYLSIQDRDFLLTYFCTHHKILEISSAKESSIPTLELARIKVLQAQRQYLIKLWEAGEIDDSLLGRLEHELDIEETHFARGEIS